MELKCVRCHSAGLTTISTMLECHRCAARYPVVRGVPRFVPSESYSESFGYQWNRFARAQLDSANGTTRSRDTFIEKTGWQVAELEGKRILDAGCGMGRFAEICAKGGAEVHAVDLSAAVDAAAENLGHHAGVYVYQADIMSLPFPKDSFDLVYSIGVLHHTPSTRAAFLRLVPLVKPGGAIAIWVYSTELRQYVASEVLRRVTSRLPKEWLLNISRVAVPLYHLHRVPRLGQVTQMMLPTSVNPDPTWRWLETFDWYSPKYQWKHDYEEVDGWFREAGMTEVQRNSFPVSVRGKRPTVPREPAKSTAEATRVDIVV